MTDQSKRWGIILHLSLYTFAIIPLVGINNFPPIVILPVLVPVLIWQLNKKSTPAIDPHGKAVSNCALSGLLYLLLLTGLLLYAPLSEQLKLPIYVLIGGLSLYLVICPIIGVMQARGGKVWQYPLSIPFFR